MSELTSGLHRNPSPYKLPQHVSEDRQRARQLTITLTRGNYPLVLDTGLEYQPETALPTATGPWPGASRLRKLLTRIVAALPPKELFLSELPPESRFTRPKFFRHGTHAGSMKLRQLWSRLTNLDLRPRSESAYARLMGTIPPPRIKANWQEDREFARQRLAGVNPIQIERCRSIPSDMIAKAAERYLKERYGSTFNDALDSGRLYMTNYPLLWETAVQKEVRPGAYLAAPTCLFYVDDDGTLMPIAIQLKPRDLLRNNPVFTPLNGYWDWRMARAHVQASDSHYHESISHLLETHLVSEIFAVTTHRQLHPDHPLSQLLMPHFEHTLAINEQARKNLLAPHGEIARCMAAKHSGNVNLVRLVWSSWKFHEHNLMADLRHRDVLDLPGYLYRDDSQQVLAAMADYSRGILSIWYQTDEDVRQDTELQAWAREIADPNGGRIHGFSPSINTREELFDIATSVIFRASAQHAAVNNGQFGAYGWAPNAPVAMYEQLPDAIPPDGQSLFTELDYYTALPDRERTFGQSGMVWLLSEPTMSSLLRAGEQPAFTQDHCFEAWQVVGRFRRRLKAISDAINARNQLIGFDYNYLKPQNIPHSIEI